VGAKPSIYQRPATRLTGPISPIGIFNTCSQVPTPRSLTNTGEGYHIENLEIATTLPALPF
jgi:hypothetical protein